MLYFLSRLSTTVLNEQSNGRMDRNGKKTIYACTIKITLQMHIAQPHTSCHMQTTLWTPPAPISLAGGEGYGCPSPRNPPFRAHLNRAANCQTPGLSFCAKMQTQTQQMPRSSGWSEKWRYGDHWVEGPSRLYGRGEFLKAAAGSQPQTWKSDEKFRPHLNTSGTRIMRLS